MQQAAMGADQSSSVLRRLARATPDGGGASPARLLRMALTRAAERSAGLGLTVLGVGDDTLSLDDLLPTLNPGHMMIALMRDAVTTGLVAIDLELRTALIEAQTIGRLRAKPAEDRPITATDAAMAQPLLAAFLAELAHGAQGSPLQTWAEGLMPHARLSGLRAVEQTLPDGDYRLVRMSVDLGAGERQGQFLIAVALPKPDAPGADTGGPQFAAALRANVLVAEAELNAILHRLQLPLEQAESLRVGQILPLTGVTVTSVRLEAPDGQTVGRARLGQTSGQRAVRIESGLGPVLQESGLIVAPAAGPAMIPGA